MRSRRQDAALVVAAMLILIGGAAAALLALAPGAPASGPAPIPWDRAVCSECAMHVGEPRFAAQLRDSHGDLHVFDDPGCLFTWRRHAGAVTGVYFHAGAGDAWLAQGEVAFVEQQPTPMGYGLLAVPLGTPNAMTEIDALTLLVARHRLGSGGERGAAQPAPDAGGHP